MKFYQILVTTATLAFIFSSQSTNAQSTPREIGIRAGGLDNFNFIYKKQLRENKFLRLRTGAFNLNANSLSNNLNAGIIAAIGFENRRPIDDKLSFTYGFEPSLAVNYSSQNSNSVINTMFSAGYVLGFNLNISDSFGLNIETIPALNVNYMSRDGDADLGLGFGFNSNSIALTAVYRFIK